MPNRIFPLNIPPGIQRDGTMFDAKSWTDGSWTRFQRGRPKKMGGYMMVSGSQVGIPRGAYVISDAPYFNFYYGTSDHLQYITLNQDKQLIGGTIDRTPSVFVSDPNNMWMFDTMYDNTLTGSVLIAHAAPNLAAIDNIVETPVYYGQSTTTSPLIQSPIKASGGIVALHPYLFFYGNDGVIGYSAANDPTTIENEARVASDKIIFGLQTRGGTNSPAGLFWSLNAVIRCTNVGSLFSSQPVEFNFDTVTTESSILSNQCVIEYDSLYFWCGVDRFLCYNGTVIELENNYSINFFFENLNYDQRQKVWATKITQFGEIWWHFPKGNSTECNHAVIYNVREQYWYDTPISRGDGYFDQIFSAPIWTDNQFNSTFNSYPIWVHEQGVDQVDQAGTYTAINSYVTTPYMSWAGGSGPDQNINSVDVTVECYRMEPDFIQQQNMTLTVSGKQYANSEDITYDFAPAQPYIVFTNNTEKIDMRALFRHMRFTFTSNAIGGYYEMGKVLIVVSIGDERN